MIRKRELKITKSTINYSIFALIGVILGVMIMLQSKVLPTRVTNSISPYLSLKDTKELLYSEQNDLKSEVSDLQERITALNSENSGKTISKSDSDALTLKRAQAGLTKISGPGVVITFDDSKSNPVTEDSIVHAADLRDTINLLWGSNVEGISINGERIVFSSSIDCIVNTILINDTRLSNPFRLEAIGNPQVLEQRLMDKNILSDIHKRASENGLIYRVEINGNITLPAYSGALSKSSKGV